MQFHLDSATWLSDQVKAKLKERLAGELTKDGFLMAKSGKNTRQREFDITMLCKNVVTSFILISVNQSTFQFESTLNVDLKSSTLFMT